MQNESEDGREYEREEGRDFTLWGLLSQCRDVVLRAREEELSQYGISLVESRALYFINLIGEQSTPAMLSRWMLREHNTVMALLNRMENKGLLIKTKDPEQRNSWLISLTDKGRTAYANSLKRETIEKAFSGLSDDEQEVMQETLRKITNTTLNMMLDTSEE